MKNENSNQIYDISDNLAELFNFLYELGFNKTKNFRTYSTSYLEYKMWKIEIEHRYYDSYHEHISFELYLSEDYTNSNYINIKQSLYHGLHNCDMSRYNLDYQNFNSKCKDILKSFFKSEFRKYKIKNLVK